MKVIGYSGTFDLLTMGHMYVIGEARKIAKRVEIYMNENPTKKPKFPLDVRKAVVELSVKEMGWDNVDVIVLHNEYTAVTAKDRGVKYLIRGIRNAVDFDYENLIQQTNADVLHGAKTVFVIGPRDLASVSSSFVKTMQGPLGWHWKIKQFLPGPACDTWLMDYLKKEWDRVFPNVSIENAKVFEQLTGDAGYRGSKRHYHNLEHLIHGLDEINRWAKEKNTSDENANILKAAFFFHDAVYGTHSQLSDEEASALLWLSSTACHSGFTADQVKQVADLIRATDHFQGPNITHDLKDVLLGADLAILGQHYKTVYKQYAKNVAKEYSHVPPDKYIEGRVAVLTKLVESANKGTLFKNSYFAERYNEKAIKNMTREIEKLKSR